MCLACEEADMYYRWQLLQQIAKGEMPEGHSEDDLRALGLPLPDEIEIVEEPDGTKVVRQKAPAPQASRFCLRQPERMTALTSLTIAQARDGLKKKELQRSRTRRRTYRGGRAGARSQRLCARNAGSCARAGESVRCAHRVRQCRTAGRHSDRREGSVLHQGCAHDRLLDTSSTISSRPINRPSPRSSGATAR